jgi:hypothetical protein
MTFLPQSLDPGSNRTMQSYGIVTGDVLLVCATQNAHEQRKLSQGSKREAQVQGSQDEAVQDQQLLDQILDKVALVGHAECCVPCPRLPLVLATAPVAS